MYRFLFLLLFATSTQAQNKEITVKLPGGAPLQLVWIEAGEFVMGAEPLDPEDEELQEDAPNADPTIEPVDPRPFNQIPDHSTIIGEGFWLGKFELMQSQWESAMGTKPWQNLPSAQTDPDKPAVFISWDDAQNFVSRLNQAAGDSLYRLPSEAEWEYACRAGTTTPWSHGDRRTRVTDYVWYEKNAWEVDERFVHPAGTKIPNPWGLYDMHGNAEEWVQDWYGALYYETARELDPPGPDRGVARVLRGGSYSDPAENVRSAYRNSARPNFLSGRFGMRVLARAALPTGVEQKSWGTLKKEAR
ncbi:MAG TPA: formylglycine-generating enzyme family protein [Candidatus Latescibacteria bacterium]|nr:formylglycine-generating enzyme family protein [Candidatus Latescibacterota bacterium]